MKILILSIVLIFASLASADLKEINSCQGIPGSGTEGCDPLNSVSDIVTLGYGADYGFTAIKAKEAVQTLIQSGEKMENLTLTQMSRNAMSAVHYDAFQANESTLCFRPIDRTPWIKKKLVGSYGFCIIVFKTQEAKRNEALKDRMDLNWRSAR